MRVVKRLNLLMRQRDQNRNIIIKALKSSKKWNNQFNFINVPHNIKPSWMGFPILLAKRFRYKKKKFMNYQEYLDLTAWQEKRKIINLKKK